MCDHKISNELYNHKNYYVCMQDCLEGCVNLNWNVNDPVLWESLLPHKFEELVTRKLDDDDQEQEDEEDEEDSDDENSTA